ncbi:anoctamin-7 [Sagmatias obliquidens]|uniref:anoctamin-7 n=1 Tax=Sagmatias obliquidens TaxID=3371155 RepID=UPI000F440A63|nr:anoctamin-7 [Lagenorhynchus obliquidens]
MAALSFQHMSQPAGDAHACPLGFWPFGDPDGCDMRDVQDEDSVVRYHLFSAPWAVLRYYAEDLHLKLPLQGGATDNSFQELPNQASNWAASLLEWLEFPNILLEDVPDVPHKSYSCQFKVSNLSRFLGSENQATFFPITYRHQILFEVLAKTPYGHERKRLFGIDQPLGEGVFSAAFPQHDQPCILGFVCLVPMLGRRPPGPLTTPPEGPRALGLTQRQVRLQPWARWHKWHKYQLLDHVRRYLGEKVAFYFAWLSESRAHRPSGPPGPLAANRLAGSPTTAAPSWGFDHGGTVLGLLPLRGGRKHSLAEGRKQGRSCGGGWAAPQVAVMVMCLGSIVLYWAIMAILVCVQVRQHPPRSLGVTRLQPHGAMVNLVFILNLSKIYMALAHVLTKWGARCAAQTHRTQTTFEDTFTLNVFIFQFVNFSSPIHIAFFKGRSARGTGSALPGHAPCRAHSDHALGEGGGGAGVRHVVPLVLPPGGLQAAAGAEAWFAPRFVGYPGNYHTSPGVRSEESDQDLAWEDGAIVLGVSVSRELRGWWQRSRLCSKERKAGLARCPRRQADYELLPFQGPFDGHLEMVLQSGFITVFVAACLLAPLFALLNNRVEIRLHARKFVRERRRPLAERAQGIGICFPNLAGITRPAVISNWSRARNLRGFVTFTLARAPPALAAAHNRTCRIAKELAGQPVWGHSLLPVPSLVSGFRGDDGHHARTYWNLLAIHLAFIIHVVFSIGRVLDLLAHDIPGSVEIKVKREYYLAKQALAEDEPVHSL